MAEFKKVIEMTDKQARQITSNYYLQCQLGNMDRNEFLNKYIRPEVSEMLVLRNGNINICALKGAVF